MSGPHDALVKETFSDLGRATQEFKAVLPAGLVKALDWRTLRLIPGSHIDEELKETHSDLLFSVRARAGAQHLIHLLFEHQSNSQRLMMFRLLRYMVRIWEQWLKKRPRARTLPVVIPVVLHHSPTGWVAPTQFADLFELDASLRTLLTPFIPNFGMVLDDLSAQSDAALRARAIDTMGKLVLSMLKRHSEKKLGPDLKEWHEMMRRLQKAGGAQSLGLVIRYLMQVAEGMTDEGLVEQLIPVLGKKAKEMVMTLGEKLMEKGHRQGLQEGVQQGLRQGLRQGQRAVLLRQLRTKFAVVPLNLAKRVETASPEVLEIWTDRILSATRIEEIFES